MYKLGQKLLGFCLVLVGALFVSGVRAMDAAADGAPDVAPDIAPDIVGEAVAQGTDTLLYREFYLCRDEGKRCTVEYREPDGELIARKALDYTIGPYTPGVEIQEFRLSRNFSLTPTPEEGLVVDAGFDNYVRSRWDDLAAGESVKFRLQLLGSEKPFKMRAKRYEDEGCQPEQLCVRVEVDSWLIGLVAPPIELAYARDSRQLLRFSGLSNLRSADDKSQQVDITYRYESAVPAS